MIDNYLIHYGILGQKWGIRNYQNPDGTLTEEGRIRYSKEYNREKRRLGSNVNFARKQYAETAAYSNIHDRETRAGEILVGIMSTGMATALAITNGALVGLPMLAMGAATIAIGESTLYRHDKQEILQSTYVSDLEKAMKES